MGTLVAGPREALALGIGVEVSATATNLNWGGRESLWGPTGGIIVEQVIPFSIVYLDPWLDVQAPLQFDTNGGQPGRYLAIDLGLRVGLGLDLVQPYLGVLGQLNVIFNSAEDHGGRDNPLWGIGGDLGVDFVFSILRLGVEVRSLEVPDVVAGDVEGGALEFQALGSARFTF